MPAENGATLRTPARLAANQPMARALRIARGSRTQPEFIAALRAAGVPVGSQNQYSGWELGGDPKTFGNAAIVPAWLLVAAAREANVSVGELLTRAGVEGQDPLSDRVAELERLTAEMREDVDTWLVDRKELRSRTGMTRTEPPERLRKQAEGEA